MSILSNVFIWKLIEKAGESYPFLLNNFMFTFTLTLRIYSVNTLPWTICEMVLVYPPREEMFAYVPKKLTYGVNSHLWWCRVSDFNLHFYVGNVINNNWNTLWDISFNNFFNKFGSELVLMWAQQIQVQVDEIYAQLLLPNINGMLNDVSMSKLIDFFVQQSMEFDMANCTL